MTKLIIPSQPLVLPATAKLGVEMPRTPPAINHVEGEEIGNLGREYTIVPLGKWADTAIFTQAAVQAHRVFRRSDTNVPNLKMDEQHILVQEYHHLDRIAFLFAAWGRKMGMRKWGWIYHPVVIKLSPQLKASLVLAGRWTTITKH